MEKEKYTLTETHIKCAIALDNAINRAADKKETTYIRIYHKDGRVHIGQLLEDVAKFIDEVLLPSKEPAND
jgi:hypothetical protein